MANKNTNLYLGLLLSAVVLANLGLWVYVATQGAASFEQTRQTYLNFFPAFLQNPALLTGLNVAFCIVSLVLLLRMGESLSRIANLVRIPAVSLNALLIAWNVFTLL